MLHNIMLQGYFMAMCAACVAALTLLLPLANAQSHNQRRDSVHFLSKAWCFHIATRFPKPWA